MEIVHQHFHSGTWSILKAYPRKQSTQLLQAKASNETYAIRNEELRREFEMELT